METCGSCRYGWWKNEDDDYKRLDYVSLRGTCFYDQNSRESGYCVRKNMPACCRYKKWE